MMVHIGWVIAALIGGATGGLFAASLCIAAGQADARKEAMNTGDHLAKHSESQGPQPPVN